MKTRLITGATGLIGKAITDLCLNRGWKVHYLTTSKSKLKKEDRLKGFYWNPDTEEIDISALNEVSTIINLAGAPIAERWTSSYKKEIINSRVNSLELLHKSLQNNDLQVEQLISASAIGYYPDSSTVYYEEDMSNNQEDFIISVVRQWEEAAMRFESLNVDVACVRIGIVLSENGGALEKLVKPIKAYVGSALGSGEQWQSWIHIKDLANIFLHVLDKRLKGIFNGVAPNPVQQKTLVKHLAQAVNRPVILPPVPEFVLKLILGEMHVIVTSSQRVSSRKIENTGFHFEFHQIDHALSDLFEE